MLLRVSNPYPMIVEIDKMSYDTSKGIFHVTSGGNLITDTLSESDWQRLVSDMFVDGKLSYSGKVIYSE